MRLGHRDLSLAVDADEDEETLGAPGLRGPRRGRAARPGGRGRPFGHRVPASAGPRPSPVSGPGGSRRLGPRGARDLEKMLTERGGRRAARLYDPGHIDQGTEDEWRRQAQRQGPARPGWPGPRERCTAPAVPPDHPMPFPAPPRHRDALPTAWELFGGVLGGTWADGMDSPGDRRAQPEVRRWGRDRAADPDGGWDAAFLERFLAVRGGG